MKTDAVQVFSGPFEHKIHGLFKITAMLESWLAFFHISAFLAWIVFGSSVTAICRHDWLNEAVVQRLNRLNRTLWIATLFVFLTGFARTWWGAKGFDWYWSNPLLYVKVILFVVAILMTVGPTRRFLRWKRMLHAQGELPSVQEVRGARISLLLATHVVAVIPLPAVFMARGFGG